MPIQQISVFLENRPGQLVQITAILAQAQIDLRAINIAESADFGVIRLITTSASATAALLKEEGFVVSVTPVIAAAVPNVVGGLNQVLTIMADAGIDVEYMYSIFGQTDENAYMIFRVEKPEELNQILEEKGIAVAGPADLRIKE